MSRAADGTSAVQDLDFSSLRSQLGPLAAVSSYMLRTLFPFLNSGKKVLTGWHTSMCFQILLCIDVASTSAKSAKMSQQLLDQAMFTYL